MKRIHLNLATTEYYDRRSFYSIVAAAALLALILSLFNVRIYSHYRAQLRDMEDRISLLDKIEGDRTRAAHDPLPAPSAKEIETVREQAGLVNRLVAMDVFPWDRLLDEIETCTPPDILLLRFATTKETNRIRIEGKAGSMKEITEFLKALDRSALYRESALLKVATLREPGRTATPNEATDVRFEMETVADVGPLYPKQSGKKS